MAKIGKIPKMVKIGKDSKMILCKPSWITTFSTKLEHQSNCFLNTSLGSSFQRLTTLSLKKFLLFFNLDLPWWNLSPFPFGKRGCPPPCSQDRAAELFLQLSLPWLRQRAPAVHPLGAAS